ncbi:hypothetical protein DPMN_085905 [Dreissena polymorpha]|uniref:JAB1/MPN/MOV34 metalloenzyme domain-containing protein n=1 Tax=Dreissena polymorpha TaxID=45954 RepID=A0A9D3YGY8_DREPO|nr:hypothetical protein DPMN_085905 [Dreissena polymorpha]
MYVYLMELHIMSGEKSRSSFKVVLKIIKHCQEEGTAGQELVQGVLLGLEVDNRLEITNCFPFPRHSEEEDFDEVQYQMEMMRNLRKVNIDHLHSFRLTVQLPALYR